jgi:drug/metabolite transporter (DMT)-like permease
MRLADRLGFDIFLLVLANMIWGATDVVAKLAISEMTPEALAWTRFTIALLTFSPALWKRRFEIPRTVRGLLPFVILGVCGFFLNHVLTYRGLRLAPASHATTLRITESLVIAAL